MMCSVQIFASRNSLCSTQVALMSFHARISWSCTPARVHGRLMLAEVHQERCELHEMGDVVVEEFGGLVSFLAGAIARISIERE